VIVEPALLSLLKPPLRDSSTQQFPDDLLDAGLGSGTRIRGAGLVSSFLKGAVSAEVSGTYVAVTGNRQEPAPALPLGKSLIFEEGLSWQVENPNSADFE
jgi:hypothetical protein